MLWTQKKRRRTIVPECIQDDPPEAHRDNDSWIKSHYSCLSEERLPIQHYVSTSNNVPPPEPAQGRTSTTVRVDTITSTHGEGGPALRRESFASKQKVCGTSVTKEVQKETGKPSSMEEATWAAVAACVKDIDTKGKHLANSMLKRAAVCQNTGHLESRDISPEELKVLEEVELKLKGKCFSQRENNIAGTNQTHTIYNSAQSHQGHPTQNHQNLPAYSSHQGHHHPGHPSQQGYPSPSSHQSHPGHSSHQAHPDHSGHQNHQIQSGHPSHQSHSMPN